MQATGLDMAPLSLLVTTPHLSHGPGLSEAGLVLGNINRVILGEADASPAIRWSVSFLPFLLPFPSPFSF